MYLVFENDYKDQSPKGIWDGFALNLTFVSSQCINYLLADNMVKNNSANKNMEAVLVIKKYNAH